MNYLEKVILYGLLKNNHIEIKFEDINNFFILLKRENTIVGFNSDFEISSLIRIKDILILKDTLSIVLNDIISLDYMFFIENNIINIEAFTYDNNIPKLIENIEVFEAKWENGIKILGEKLKIPIKFIPFSLVPNLPIGNADKKLN